MGTPEYKRLIFLIFFGFQLFLINACQLKTNPGLETPVVSPGSTPDSIDVDRFLADSAYKTSVMKGFVDLEGDTLRSSDTIRLFQLLRVDKIPNEDMMKLSFIAAKYKVCASAPALIKLMEKRIFLSREPKADQMAPDQALIKLGSCAHPYLREYLINGESYPVKSIISQIMWHYLGSDPILLDSLEMIRSDCRTSENQQHLDDVVKQLKKRMKF